VKVVIEMPKGSQDKAEIDKETGTLIVDRTLDVKVPYNYGFIVNTLAQDGDALDAFVLGSKLDGLTELDAIPIGVFLCLDQGVPDHKILAVPWTERDQDVERSISDIAKYLSSYKPGFEVLEYTNDIMRTLGIIKSSRLHRAKPIYRHETLGWRRLIGVFILAGFIWLLSRLS
jgi:Inorganic pyrophosphatase